MQITKTGEGRKWAESINKVSDYPDVIAGRKWIALKLTKQVVSTHNSTNANIIVKKYYLTID